MCGEFSLEEKRKWSMMDGRKENRTFTLPTSPARTAVFFYRGSNHPVYGIRIVIRATSMDRALRIRD